MRVMKRFTSDRAERSCREGACSSVPRPSRSREERGPAQMAGHDPSDVYGFVQQQAQRHVANNTVIFTRIIIYYFLKLIKWRLYFINIKNSVRHINQNSPSIFSSVNRALVVEP